MDLTEYMKRDATALAESVRGGDITAVELLKLARERAAAVNPQLNAIIVPMDEIADARVNEDLSGPFAGVPFLIKDIAQEYKGVPTSYGSRALKDDVAKEHSEVVNRWLNVGLVMFGKTNIPEFGAKGITEPELWGPAKNPWTLKHTPGGSSGGSAAAVAAGIVPAAGANDGGGSIRIPAACCGLVGLKPGRGVTPYGPSGDELLHGMIVQGVVSRTVRDSAGLLDAIVGPEQGATFRVEKPEQTYVDAIKTAPGKLRIGYSVKSSINTTPDPEAIVAVENAAALLTELGHEVEEVAPPYDDGALALDFLTLWFAELSALVAKAKKSQSAKNSDFESDTLAVAELGRSAGVVRAAEALARRNVYSRSLAAFHETHDYLLTPTLAKPPLPIGELTTPRPLQAVSRAVVVARAGKVMDKLSLVDQLIEENLGWVPYTQLANVTGRPALSMPLHWTKDNLPLGVQFVGKLGSEGALLQLATQLEAAQPWFDRYATIKL